LIKIDNYRGEVVVVGVGLGVAPGFWFVGAFLVLGFGVREVVGLGGVVGLGDDVVVGIGDDGCALATEVKLVVGIANPIPQVRAIATNFVILLISHLTKVLSKLSRMFCKFYL
jgi:hypothetical protein